MNVYFISGLGADRRAFDRLRLSKTYTPHYLDWIEPLSNESLNDYAKRLATGIDTSQPFCLVGLSMGGMIAAIMTSFLTPYRTVLISSIGCNKEFPRLLKFSRSTKAHRILPDFIFRSKNLSLVQRLFGTKASGEKKMIQYFIENTSPHFMQWAINAIINWKDDERPSSVFQIHGNRDKMFPIKYTKPDVIINDGSHFMVFTKAAQVSAQLEKALA